MLFEYEYPSRRQLLEFTNGEWDNLPPDVRPEIKQACRLKLDETKRLEAWEELCPPEYHNTSSERLQNLEKFQQVQKWRYGSVGLLLVGPTRRGKTRSVWKLLERMHFGEHRGIVAFNPMDLKLQVAKAWQNTEEAEQWIGRVRNVEILFFDDLDTVKFTEAVEETIYDAFEFRPTHGKPIIATVNRTGRELAARMNANGRGAKIVERMREYCDVINFS